jgi:hypothetical protein
VIGLGDGEFFDFDGNTFGFELGQNHIADVSGEFFDELPALAVAEFQEPLGDSEVVNGVSDGIGLGGAGEIEVHFDGQEEALGVGAFLVRHADAVRDFKINDGDFHA